MTEPTTPLPESPFCRVRARVASIWADGTDAGTSPDWRPAVGEKVTLTPSIGAQLLVYDVAGPEPIIVTVERVQCEVDADGWLVKPDGRPVYIAPTDDPRLSATGWTWTATIKNKSIPFPAPAGGVVNLALYIDDLAVDATERISVVQIVADYIAANPPDVEQAVADYLTANPPAGTGGSGVTVDDTPAAPAEGQSASYLVTSAVTWPVGLVWSTDPDGGVAPTITGTALVSLFTVDGTTRAIMGATFPAPPDLDAPVAGTLAVVPSSTSALGTVTGASDAVALDPEPYSFRLDAGAWSAWQASASYDWTGLTASTSYTFQHRVRDAAGNITEGAAVTDTTDAPAVDSTPPTVGIMTATSISDTGFTVTVTGAADDTALDAAPYAFTTDGGTTWTAYQASPVYVASGLTAETAYSVNWRVKDEAGNVSTGTAQTVTTTDAAATSAYPDEVLADAPLAYWRLGEDSGSAVLDSSGNERPLNVLQGTYTRGVPGAIADDLATSATKALGPLSDAEWMDVTALTVEAIVKTTAASIGTILRRDGGSSPNRIFMFRINADGTATMATWAGATLHSATSTVTVNDGAWHHIAGVADGTDTRLYIDGVEAATVTSGALQTGNAMMSMFSHGAYMEPLIGTLDEVAMYGAALSPARIAAHAAAAGL